MTSPASEFSTMIANAGLGVKGAATGWAVFTGDGPDQPDSIITSIDTGSLQPPSPKFSRDFPTVQVAVRGDVEDFENGFAKCQAIKDELLGKTQEIIGVNNYIGIYMLTDIISLGRDEKERPRFSLNFRAVREQPATGNRI